MDTYYFRFRLNSYEARAFIRGLQRRQRPFWEQARYIASYAAAPHCKDFDVEKMGRFTWEAAETHAEIDEAEAEAEAETHEAELAAVRARAIERDKLFNELKKK